MKMTATSTPSTLLRTACVPLVVSVFVGTINSFFPRITGFGVLLGAIVVVAWAIVVIVRGVRSLRRRVWQEAALLLVILVGIWPLIGLCIRSGDYIHLAILYPHYLNEIETTHGGDRTTVKFPWGDAAAFVSNGMLLRVLIYDPSGELARMTDERRDPDSGLLVSYRPLVGKFYIELAHYP